MEQFKQLVDLGIPGQYHGVMVPPSRRDETPQGLSAATALHRGLPSAPGPCPALALAAISLASVAEREQAEWEKEQWQEKNMATAHHEYDHSNCEADSKYTHQ